MAAHIDKEVLLGFIEEAKSYLPVIRQGLATFQADSTRVEALEEAHRHAHTIKGAASMVGLAGLSHIAYFVEETLEAIGAGQLDMNEETVAWLGQTLIYIEVYLENILDGSVEERPLLIEVTQSYRRLRGLPAEEDEAALATVLARIVERPAATVPDEPDEPDEVFDDELSPELLEAFYMEAEDHLRNIHLALASLNKDPDQQDLLQVVRRGVHTLKGAAATVGLSAMAELTTAWRMCSICCTMAIWPLILTLWPCCFPPAIPWKTCLKTTPTPKRSSNCCTTCTPVMTSCLVRTWSAKS